MQFIINYSLFFSLIYLLFPPIPTYYETHPLSLFTKECVPHFFKNENSHIRSGALYQCLEYAILCKNDHKNMIKDPVFSKIFFEYVHFKKHYGVMPDVKKLTMRFTDHQQQEYDTVQKIVFSMTQHIMQYVNKHGLGFENAHLFDTKTESSLQARSWYQKQCMIRYQERIKSEQGAYKIAVVPQKRRKK